MICITIVFMIYQMTDANQQMICDMSLNEKKHLSVTNLYTHHILGNVIYYWFN